MRKSLRRRAKEPLNIAKKLARECLCTQRDVRIEAHISLHSPHSEKKHAVSRANSEIERVMRGD